MPLSSPSMSVKPAPTLLPSVVAIRRAVFAFGLILPLTAFAELSNESMLGPGLRWRPAYDGSAINKKVSVRLEGESFGNAGDTNNAFTTPGKSSNSNPKLISAGLQYGF